MEVRGSGRQDAERLQAGEELMQDVVCTLMKTFASIYSCEKIPGYLIPKRVRLRLEVRQVFLCCLSFNSTHCNQRIVLWEKRLFPQIFLEHPIIS